MKVICALCDTGHELDIHSLQAKTLRNHPIKVYICQSCKDKITESKKQKT